MFDRCLWLNEPRRWSLGPDGLSVTTDPKTDFWRETHYGFTHHNGRAFGCETSGGFTATVRVRARLAALYDQAGIMVVADVANWAKAGIELSDGEPLLSSELTVGRSDWGVGAFNGDPSDFWVRATVDQGVLRIHASADGRRWPLIRLCPFPDAAPTPSARCAARRNAKGCRSCSPTSRCSRRRARTCMT